MDKPFIGQLNVLIQIVRFESTRNELNEEQKTQVVVCNPYAKMEDISGGEDVEGKIRYLVNRKYTIRLNSEVKALKNKLALIDDGVTYDVVNVIPIGRTHLQLIVKNYE
ncbi:phage head completion protein [Flavobacterium algicola]|uniref:phage head completion protein n=1 Tax=Flavobacterium algicola TaxID=556529 RepID=UPI001EFE62A3|nr:hypothetical protein [Flavobacterium algicola]MCG9792486.1 hypothetical protein [Flavobacterium algicola]